MRLINIKLEHRMFFEEFNEPEIPEYAILSHTWDKDEISYAEASAIFSSYGFMSASSKAGFEKMKQFAAAARKTCFQYIWIDTCCIDKRSSAELSEAVNCMYQWYRKSAYCYIYLADVPEQPNSWHLPATRWSLSQAVKQSRWLTRGWTLQELLAPRNLHFFSMNWTFISSPQLVLQSIAEETGIPMEAIGDFKPSRWSIAQKMSWAAHRQTTRIEDRAYSLLGLFNVNIPLIYGEGNAAFRRLQEEILRNSTDQTIFCWTTPDASFSTWRGLLARSPSEFANSGNFIENKRVMTEPSQLTNKGIQMSLKLVPANLAPGDFVALLQCYSATSTFHCGIYMRRIHDDNYIRVAPNHIIEVSLFWKRTHAAFSKMLFAKPELAGITWQKLDMCSRIAGFRFPSIPCTLSVFQSYGLWDRSNLWIDDVVPQGKGRFSWHERTFSFYIDPDVKVPKFTIARCYLESALDCGIEIWVRYDWEKAYGEYGEGFEIDNGICSTTNLLWEQSECCEWRIQREGCDQFEISVSSWIELDDKSDAYIQVEFRDSANHDNCGSEKWEGPLDLTQWWN